MKNKTRVFSALLFVTVLLFTFSPLTVQAADIIIENSDAGVTYVGGWAIYSDGRFHGGDFRYSNGTDAYWTYTFTGSSYKIYTSKESNRGICGVYIDNVFVANYDEYSASIQDQSNVYSGTVPYGSHTLKVVVTGTKNASSSNYYCSFDYLTYDDAAPTNTPTNTHTPTFTPTNTNTPIPTATDTPTFTPTNTATFTPTYTATFTATSTVTLPPTATDTNTPTKTSTPTETRTPTNTPTITPTRPSATPITPVWVMVPEITYGDYMQSVILLGLCGVAIIAMVVIFTMLNIKRK